MSRVFAHQPAHSPHVWGLTPRGNTVGCAFPLALSLIPKRVVPDSYPIRLDAAAEFPQPLQHITKYASVCGYRCHPKIFALHAWVSVLLYHTNNYWLGHYLGSIRE